MNCIIFSKNRACQLELLLRTMVENWPDCKEHNVQVMWTATDGHLAEGYRIVFSLYPWVEHHCESSFRHDLIALFDTAQEHSMFLVDDIVWRAPWDMDEAGLFDEFRRDERIACISLRLCRRTNYCYSMKIKQPQPVPPEGLEYMLWKWGSQVGDWSYPMSLDGHVFRTRDIYPRLVADTYNNPNTLEDRLAGNPINKPLMACYFDSKLFGVPLNRVQDVRLNRSANMPVSDLNDLFLAGRHMSSKPYQGYQNGSAHEVVAPTWESRL